MAPAWNPGTASHRVLYRKSTPPQLADLQQQSWAVERKITRHLPQLADRQQQSWTLEKCVAVLTGSLHSSNSHKLSLHFRDIPGLGSPYWGCGAELFLELES